MWNHLKVDVIAWHLSKDASHLLHAVHRTAKAWRWSFLTAESPALPQLSVCSPGCRVTGHARAKWVRVEARARPWPHASTSPPVPQHHQHHQQLHKASIICHHPSLQCKQALLLRLISSQWRFRLRFLVFFGLFVFFCCSLVAPVSA